jgi:hypothetical protein
MQSVASSFAAGRAVVATARPNSQRQQQPFVVTAKDSRIGKQPIPVPEKVTVTLEGQTVKVKVRGRVLGSLGAK